MGSVTIREVTGTACPPPLDPWKNTILARLPHVLDSVVEVELENTLAEFSKETLVWQETIGPETLLANANTIYLNPYEDDKIILFVEDVYYKDQPLTKASSLGKYYNKTTGSLPDRFFSPSPSVVRLIPTPTTAPAEGFYFKAFFMPRDASVYLPDFFFNVYFEPILDGALARLFSHTAKPYSNTQMAMFHARRFRAGITSAKIVAKSGNVVGGEPSWGFPNWALK